MWSLFYMGIFLGPLSFLGGYVKFYCLFIVIIVLLVNIVCFRLLVLFVSLFVCLLFYYYLKELLVF